MNKLDEYKEFVACREYTPTFGGPFSDIDRASVPAYVGGFNHCLALNIPIKFAEWLDKNYNRVDIYKNNNLWSPKTDLFLDKMMTTQEVYKYWVENIFDPYNS